MHLEHIPKQCKQFNISFTLPSSFSLNCVTVFVSHDLLNVEWISHPQIFDNSFYCAMDVDHTFTFGRGELFHCFLLVSLRPVGIVGSSQMTSWSFNKASTKLWEGRLLTIVFIFSLISGRRIRNLRSWSQEELQQQDHLQRHLIPKQQRPKRSLWRRNRLLSGRRWRPPHRRR